MFTPHIQPVVHPGHPVDRAIAPAAPVERAHSAAAVGREPEERPRPRPSGPTIGTLACRQVITVTPDTTLRELATLFTERRISGAPVVDPSDGRLLGLVSQADLAAHMAGHRTDHAEPGYYHAVWYEIDNDPEEGVVADIMTPYVFYATEDTPIPEVVDLMLENDIHRVVVTRAGRLAGVVTTMDLLRHLRGRS